MLSTALCLLAPDIEALMQGRMIVAMSRRSIYRGQQFALCPIDISLKSLPIEQWYNSRFLSTAQTVVANLNSESNIIRAWAKCEMCQDLDSIQYSDDIKFLDNLSQLTVWTREALQETLLQWHHIFLIYLRVHPLPRPDEVSISSKSRDEIGRFVPLPKPITDIESSPVLEERIFTQRKRQLENREPPLHPELEELGSAISQLDNPAAVQLNNEIRQLLGWASQLSTQQHDLQPSWIDTIKDLGNRSKELDTGKSNYQAGTDFEKIVRDSLEFLGFTIDYAHRGGAGGLDLFCSKPYPLFGECKAGKKIPNSTAVQLLNLGTLRRPELFSQATKLIIGPGEPTDQLKEAAKVHGMAIINPETLEKLVKLQSKYHNSVDLFKLEDYLKPGQADDEVKKYIDQVFREIKLRSQIVQAVKELSEQDSENSGVMQKRFTITEIRAHYNATQHPKLNDEVVRDLLVELSSPLTGYLGRNKESDGRGFYFLRDLHVDR